MPTGLNVKGSFMKKYLLIMLVALALTLTLVSCGGQSQSTTTTTKQIIPEPPAHTHNYAEWDIVKKPNCTENGEKVRYCSCGEKQSEVVIAWGHTESDWIVDFEATTTTEGSKHTQCTSCGITIKSETIDKLPKPASEGLAFALNSDGLSYSVTGIGTCTDTDIVIPSEYNGLPVASIGNWAFYSCESLTSVVIPDSVTSIGDRAFEYCPSLESIEIPDSVTSIGSHAFQYCHSLTNIDISDSITSIGKFAFDYCTSLKSINVDTKNKYYKSIDGNLYTKDGKTLIQYAIGKEATCFAIPNSVTSIGGYAFDGCTSLTSIEIPNSVTSIGEGAFVDCTSLVSIEIPNSVTSIGNGVFMRCGSFTSIVIPDSVISIGEYAFLFCWSLESIEIPDSVISIAEGAFYGCTSLTSINFEGTVEQWNDIELGDYWNDGMNGEIPATEVICSNGTVSLK